MASYGLNPARFSHQGKIVSFGFPYKLFLQRRLQREVAMRALARWSLLQTQFPCTSHPRKVGTRHFLLRHLLLLPSLSLSLFLSRSFFLFSRLFPFRVAELRNFSGTLEGFIMSWHSRLDKLRLPHPEGLWCGGFGVNQLSVWIR